MIKSDVFLEPTCITFFCRQYYQELPGHKRSWGSRGLLGELHQLQPGESKKVIIYFWLKPFYKFKSFEQFDKRQSSQSRQSVAGGLSITHVNELLLATLEAYFLVFLFSFTIHTCKSNFALFLWESEWVFKFLIQILNKIISIHPEKWEFEIMKVVVWESFENWEKEMYLNFLFLVLGEHNPPGGVAGKCLPGLHHFTQSYQRLMQRCRNSIVWPNLINARTRDAKMIESTSPHFGSTNKYMKCVYLKTKIFHKRKYTVPFFWRGAVCAD